LDEWQSRAAVAVLLAAIMLTACGGDDEDAAAQPATANTTTSQANRAPQIAGTPRSALVAGENYLFKPAASDANGDPLTFSVENRPRWLGFDPANGTLSGTPSVTDVGTYQRLTITVSDGKAIAALGPFNIAVQRVAGTTPSPVTAPAPVTDTGTKAVALSWAVPTEYEDGTVFTDLAGYRIRYGVSPGNYANLVEVSPGTTSHNVYSLNTATYYFSITAFNYAGVESTLSNEVAIALN
jgi:hypothetical protein